MQVVYHRRGYDDYYANTAHAVREDDRNKTVCGVRFTDYPEWSLWHRSSPDYDWTDEADGVLACRRCSFLVNHWVVEEIEFRCGDKEYIPLVLASMLDLTARRLEVSLRVCQWCVGKPLYVRYKQVSRWASSLRSDVVAYDWPERSVALSVWEYAEQLAWSGWVYKEYNR